MFLPATRRSFCARNFARVREGVSLVAPIPAARTRLVRFEFYFHPKIANGTWAAFQKPVRHSRLHVLQIVRQIRGIEFANDPAFMTKQALMRDVIPLCNQVRRYQHGLPPRSFELQNFLQSLPPPRSRLRPGSSSSNAGASGNSRSASPSLCRVPPESAAVRIF